jgi:PHD/YefM family antitoxin component YafN of YafNO toxin-antitoxin module
MLPALAQDEVVMDAHEERYVVDRNGNRVGVVLNMAEYERLLADLEELESIRAFDRAKASGEPRIPFERAVTEIERRHK